MKLRIWNTLGREYDDITPTNKDGVVRIYNCGPTVYSTPHIGNIRRFVVADLMVKTLRAFGEEVRSVMNITDVGHLHDTDHAEAGEDKMLIASQREKIKPEEVAAKYTQDFFESLQLMRLEPADYYPRATLHVPMMIKLTQKLLEKGFAYETGTGVYFEVPKFSEYGKLSGNKVAAIEPGARVGVREEKKNAFDFALWIKAEEGHLMQWDSPWGRGYPGWHIECSAMAQQLLGETIDVHTGGIDNMFPHHENEIAQSESSSSKIFSKIWVHNEHLLVNGKKMAKSDGSFLTLSNVLEKKFSPLALKMLFLQTHYRSKLNFTWESLAAAADGLKNINTFIADIQKGFHLQMSENNNAANTNDLKEYRDNFSAAMANDLGTPQALAIIFDLIRTVNPLLSTGRLSENESRGILDLMIYFDSFLSIFTFDISSQKIEISTEVLELVEKRENARKSKDYLLSDTLRENIKKHGYDVKDTPTGPQLTSLRES